METPNNEESYIEIPEGGLNISRAKEVLALAKEGKASPEDVNEMIRSLQEEQAASEEARNDLGVRAVLAGLIATRKY